MYYHPRNTVFLIIFSMFCDYNHIGGSCTCPKYVAITALVHSTYLTVNSRCIDVKDVQNLILYDKFDGACRFFHHNRFFCTWKLWDILNITSSYPCSSEIIQVGCIAHSKRDSELYRTAWHCRLMPYFFKNSSWDFEADFSISIFGGRNV
jgi:hypothetical protein